MTKRVFQIQSIFSKWLGAKARELAAKGEIEIVQIADFPDGAPIHEDGSAEYDPRKPLVLFAIKLTTAKAIDHWQAVLREYDDLGNAQA